MCHRDADAWHCRSRRVLALRITLPVAALVAGLLLCPAGSAVAQTPPPSTQNALAGSRVFGSKGCIQCHSIRGLGAREGPDLGISPGRRSFYEFGAAMWNHLPSMLLRMRELGLERPRLDAGETGDLIAFLFWLDYFEPPGNQERGKQLFSDRACIACHQSGGVGGVGGPSLDFLSQYGSPIQVATALWNHGPAMAAAMQRRGLERPTFAGNDLIDLVAFLRAGSPLPPDASLHFQLGREEIGRAVFEEKGCVRCHGVEGKGGQIAPSLSAASRNRSVLELAAAMWNKAPAMTLAMEQLGISVPQLQAGEMADLVAYLYSVQYFAEDRSAARGKTLLTDKGCLGCHALEGRGGKSAGDLALSRGLGTPAAIIAAMWNHAFVPAQAGEAWPRFAGSEMADLAAFFESASGAR